MPGRPPYRVERPAGGVYGPEDGITACRELRSRQPELLCLMLTSFADDALSDAIKASVAE